MFLYRVGSTTWAASCPERDYLPLICAWGLFLLEVLLEETQEGSVLWQQVDLVKHPLDVTTDANGMLPEP